MSFILTDGNVINSYGFRVNTEGIEMSRFSANPVMLADHWDGISGVLGKWINIQRNGAQITAEPEFDLHDPNAVAIKGKVDRGYLKGASLGLTFDPDDMQKMPDGSWELKKCEVLEASITPIPSNASALKLYAKADGKLLTANEIKLAISQKTETNFSNDNKNDMKKIALSQAALIALNLLDLNQADGVDVELVIKKITELAASAAQAKADLKTKEAELTAATTALDKLQTQAQAAKQLAAETLINTAIAEGRLSATEKDGWVKLALNNEELAKKTLSAIPAKKSLGASVNNPDPSITKMSMDEFAKLTDEQQLNFKNEHPELYKEFLESLKA